MQAHLSVLKHSFIPERDQSGLCLRSVEAFLWKHLTFLVFFYKGRFSVKILNLISRLLTPSKLIPVLISLTQVIRRTLTKMAAAVLQVDNPSFIDFCGTNIPALASEFVQLSVGVPGNELEPSSWVFVPLLHSLPCFGQAGVWRESIVTAQSNVGPGSGLHSPLRGGTDSLWQECWWCEQRGKVKSGRYYIRKGLSHESRQTETIMTPTSELWLISWVGFRVLWWKKGGEEVV